MVTTVTTWYMVTISNTGGTIVTTVTIKAKVGVFMSFWGRNLTMDDKKMLPHPPYNIYIYIISNNHTSFVRLCVHGVPCVYV